MIAPRWTIPAVFVALLLGAALPADAQRIRDRDDIPELRGVEVVEPAGQALPLDAVFTNAQNETVTLGDYFDGELPVLVVPSYFDCPLLCPMTQTRVAQALNGTDLVAGTDFRVVTYSFDPSENYREAAAKQAQALGTYTFRDRVDDADRAWAFLTTDAENAKRVSTALGFYYTYVPASGEFSHGAAVYFCTPDGAVHNVIEGLDFGGEEIEQGLIDARDGNERSIFASAFLWCIQMVAGEGENTPLYMRLMTIGASLGALILFLIIGFFIFRSAKGPAAVAPAAAAAAAPPAPEQGPGEVENRE